MGFLDRAIRRGISEGIGKAVGGAIEKAVAPKAEQLANQTARQLDQAAQAKDAQIMAQWDEKLPQYPKWNLGGNDFNIEQYDGYIMFAVKMGNSISAQNAVRQYRALLVQNGFRPAGEAPDSCHLYKMVGGICYHCDTEHCFDVDSDCPTFSFTTEEPIGGFDYVKPEPKKTSFKDLLNF